MNAQSNDHSVIDTAAAGVDGAAPWLEMAPGSQVVLVFDPRTDDPSADAAGRFAATLASTAGGSVLVYDRSEETWGDSQHPEGPFDASEAEHAGRHELAAEMRRIEGLGTPAEGWVATLPSLSAVTSAIAEVEATLVVVPESMRPKLLERALIGRSAAEIIATQVARNPELPAMVVEVSAEGTPTLFDDETPNA